MRKKVFLVVNVAILSMAFVQAQVNFGVRAGLNMSNMKTSVLGLSLDTKMKPGIQLGVVGELSLLDIIAIQPGIIFSQQGFKIDDFLGSKISATETLNYIQVPVNVMYKVNLGVAKLLLQAGPYLGYGLSGKTKAWLDGKKIEGEDFKEMFGDEKIKFGSGDEDDYKALDFGLGFGAGVQFSSFQVCIGYNAGLMNFAPEIPTESGIDLKPKAKNNNIALTVTYLFGK